MLTCFAFTFRRRTVFCHFAAAIHGGLTSTLEQSRSFNADHRLAADVAVGRATTANKSCSTFNVGWTATQNRDSPRRGACSRPAKSQSGFSHTCADNRALCR